MVNGHYKVSNIRVASCHGPLKVYELTSLYSKLDKHECEIFCWSETLVGARTFCEGARVLQGPAGYVPVALKARATKPLDKIVLFRPTEYRLLA